MTGWSFHEVFAFVLMVGVIGFALGYAAAFDFKTDKGE